MKENSITQYHRMTSEMDFNFVPNLHSTSDICHESFIGTLVKTIQSNFYSQTTLSGKNGLSVSYLARFSLPVTQ
jgi:hypothetical protein